MNARLFHPIIAIPLALPLLLISTGPVCADAEDRIAKSFQAASGGQLVVEADRGSIDVSTAETGTVQIEVSREAKGSAAKAKQILADHVITFDQTGSQVSVKAEYKGPKTTGWFGSSPQFNVRYQITVPRQFNATLKTAAGHIEVKTLTGKLQAHSSGGHLSFADIEGPVTAHTSGGNISLNGCKGLVDLHTSGGSLNLSAIEGDTTARTSGGSIRANKLNGKAVVKTSGGSITVSDIHGSIDAGTSGGSIRATLAEQPAGDCSFKTSGGSITLALAGSIAADVDLHTSGGHVSTELPVVSVIQGKQEKNELRGKVNGGGPLLTAHTSGGSVRLEKK